MTHHVPDDLLNAFVEGDLEERVAIHVAEHLDACPSCATRAATLEPLAAAFASVHDPEPPHTLTPRVLELLDAPPVGAAERPPAIEISLGALLLAAAAALAVVGGDPLGTLVRLGVLAGALQTAGAQVSMLANGPALSIAVGTLTLGAAMLAGARTVWSEGRLT